MTNHPKRTLTALAAIALALVLGTSASAASILQGGTAISNTYTSNFMQGYEFVPTADLSLTALGFWDGGSNGLPRSFQVGLWERDTTALLASATIDNLDALDTSLTVAGGQWRYESVGPVALTSGTSYVLAFQVGSVNLDVVDTLSLQHSTLITSPLISVPNVRPSSSNVGSFIFPTISFTPYEVGNVNAQFEAISVVPLPAAAWMAVPMLGGLGITQLVRRRRLAA